MYHEFGSNTFLKNSMPMDFFASYSELRHHLTSIANHESEQIQDGVYFQFNVSQVANVEGLVWESAYYTNLNTETMHDKNLVCNQKNVKLIMEIGNVSRRQQSD